MKKLRKLFFKQPRVAVIIGHFQLLDKDTDKIIKNAIKKFDDVWLVIVPNILEYTIFDIEEVKEILQIYKKRILLGKTNDLIYGQIVREIHNSEFTLFFIKQLKSGTKARLEYLLKDRVKYKNLSQGYITEKRLLYLAKTKDKKLKSYLIKSSYHKIKEKIWK